MYAPKEAYYRKDKERAMVVRNRAIEAGCPKDVIDLVSRLVGVYFVTGLQEPKIFKTSEISFEAAEKLIETSGGKKTTKRAKKAEKVDG
jgi:hypothetical protein